MVSVGDWSETPGSNSTVDGVNIAEGCPTGNVNGAIRAVMAGVKTFKVAYDALAATVAGKLSASGAVFSGTQPTYTGRGAYLHHASASNASGLVTTLPEGSALPTSPANGDIVLFYTP